MKSATTLSIGSRMASTRSSWLSVWVAGVVMEVFGGVSVSAEGVAMAMMSGWQRTETRHKRWQVAVICRAKSERSIAL